MDLRPGALKQRNLVVVAILSTVTLGLYNIYLAWCWAEELNTWSPRQRNNPVLTLVVSLVTCGLAVTVFECLFARSVERDLAHNGRQPSFSGFSTTVIALNVAALVLNLTGAGGVLGIPCGVAASVLLQRELNLSASSGVETIETGDTASVGQR